MKIALAAVGFKNCDMEFNKRKIISIISEYSGKADIVLFGETFLQGFDSLCWDYEKDKFLACEISDDVINEIAAKAKNCNIAVSFGYIEKEGDTLYSSQLTVGPDGEVLDNYRRISVGWKEAAADFHYREGKNYSVFSYKGKTFAVGLCGDFWDDEKALRMKKLCPEIVLWPVYTDYDANEWNTMAKYEYEEQSVKIGNDVLYVNSVCLDEGREEGAHGGAAWFKGGKIERDIPSGNEGVLLVEL